MSPEKHVEPAAGDLEVTDGAGSGRAAAIFGGAILVVLIAMCVFIPNPSDFQCRIIRFAMALDAGFLSYFFLGGVTLQGKVSRYVLKATGGFALFVVIQFAVDPLDLQTAVADAAPGVIPPSPQVRQAQRVLSANGDYSGPIDGRLNSKTRAAIRDVQKAHRLEPDGRLDPQTRKLIVPPQ